jgi:outer membrane protein assembly factor BamB
MKRFALVLSLITLMSCASCAENAPRWEYRAAGSVSAEPVVEGDAVYVVTSAGRFVGLNRTTGIVIMDYAAPAGVYSAPAVSGDLTVVGCDNGVVYGVNISTGNRSWSYLTGGPVKSSPAIYGGVVYVGSDDGHLYALKGSSGRLIWRFNAGSPVQSKPRPDSWKVFFGAADRKAYSISNVTGRAIWNRTLGGPLKSEPGEYRDVVFFSGGDRRLYALDKYDSKVLWNYTTNGTVTGSPVVSGESVVFTSSDRRVYSVSAYFGALRWNTTLNDSSPTAPYVEGGVVYVGAGNRVYALNETDGRILWVMNVSGQVRFKPSYSKGILIAVSGSNVEAFGGAADVEVTDIVADPAIPAAGEPFTIEVEVKNSGDALAAEVDVAAYVDRVNLSKRTVTLGAGESARLRYNVTASFGRHVAEAVVDEQGRLLEPDEWNNRGGMVFSASGGWPTFQHDRNRTGFFNLGERFVSRDFKLSWTCGLNSSNRSMDGVWPLWDVLNSTEDYAIGGVVLNYSCYVYQTRGYSVGKLNSSWSCVPYNTTGYSDRNFKALRGYLRSFNETAYNLSVRHNALYYPFNVTDFSVMFNCSATPNPKLPVEDAQVRWDCKVRRFFNVTPYNVTGSWECAAKYYSNYSLSDLAFLQDYRESGSFSTIGGVDVAGYGLLWSLDTGDLVKSSPVVVDLRRDGDGRLETVFGSYDGRVYAVRSDGSVLWTVDLGSGINSVSSADIERDGETEILAGLEDGRVVCLDSAGSIVWSFKAGGPVNSAPMALDFDDAPGYEVLFGSDDGRLYAVSSRGVPLWEYQTADSVSSTPSAADVDGDGRLEVLFGSDDNVLYAVRTPPYKVWMYQTSGDVSSPKPASTYSSRAVDVVAASTDGNVYDIYYGAAEEDDIVRVCNAQGCSREGVAKTRFKLRWNFSVDGPVESSPAIADMNADGRVEIVAGSQDRGVYVVNRTGDRLMKTTLGGPVRSSPALADLDGDGVPEIVVGADDDRLYVINAAGQVLWSYETGGFVRSSPAVADIDNDGVLELIVGSYDGRLYAFGVPKGRPKPPEATTTTTTSATTSTTEADTTTTTTATTTTASTATTAAKRMDIAKPVGTDNEVKRLITVLVLIMGLYFCIIMSHHPRGPGETGSSGS